MDKTGVAYILLYSQKANLLNDPYWSRLGFLQRFFMRHNILKDKFCESIYFNVTGITYIVSTAKTINCSVAIGHSRERIVGANNTVFKVKM